MNAPAVKRSVAVVILNGSQIFATRRGENDDELPGIWGLPAGTCRGSETIHEVIRRIGRDKLGVRLTPVRKVAAGAQDRPAYRLEMELWEVLMDGTPHHPEWQWAALDVFVPGAKAGSLCCELLVNSEARE